MAVPSDASRGHRPGRANGAPATTGPVTTALAATGLVAGGDGRVRPAWAVADPLLRDYYDREWGVPVRSEQGLFERLTLEVFQSGLAWRTILAKRPAFREAFGGFDPETVAAFTDDDVARLLADATIVRNRRKIEATIANAGATIALRPDGGLAELVWSFQPEKTPAPRQHEDIPTTSPESVALARELKRRGFRHVGPTTMFALMEAVGIVDTHLVDSHRRGTSGVWRQDGSRA